MRIFVTGGSGFVGVPLVEELRRLEHSVTVLDPKGGEGTIRGDIRGDLKGLLDECDTIYHLAALSDPRTCEEERAPAWEVNVSGTRNLLEAMREGQHLVFASSAHVYGPRRKPCRVSDGFGPTSFYGLTKTVGEALVDYYSQWKGFRYTTLRLFNLYGPGQSKGFLIPDVMEKYEGGEPVVIRDPKAVRDFVYIDDALEAFLKAMKVSGVYNIGTGLGTEVAEVYRLVKKVSGVRVDDGEVEVGAGSRLVADIGETKEGLGWAPTVGLEEGIERVIGRKGGRDENRSG